MVKVEMPPNNFELFILIALFTLKLNLEFYSYYYILQKECSQFSKFEVVNTSLDV